MPPSLLRFTQSRSARLLVRTAPFYAMHIAAVAGAVWLGWSWSGFGLAIALYVIRMFGVTAGYHRYFSHRTFKTSRPMQLAFAWLAMSSFQKGVLWWAAHHRQHHKLSDQKGDVHSFKLDGFWWSHVGWIVSDKHEQTDVKRVRDLVKFPELVWLNKWHWIPGLSLSVGLYLVGGAWALVWGSFVSTVLLWHGTFTINSLTHVWGKRRYATGDDSRNNVWLALITLGEGWHNNHHYYQRATNQGFFWWEFDPTYLVLRGMQKLGLVWDIHTVPAAVRAAQRVSDQANSSVTEADNATGLSIPPQPKTIAP